MTWFRIKPFLFIVMLVSAVVFPLLILGQSMQGYIENFKFSLPTSLLYSSCLTYGNAYIFYKTHAAMAKSKAPRSTAELWKWIGSHLLFTVLLSGALASATTIEELSVGYLTKNLVGAILFSSLVIAIFEVAYTMKRLKRATQEQEKLKRANLESELEILKNQVKPHFLFNNLNTLASIIPDQPEKAVNYVEHLSSVYRHILKIHGQKVIPLEDELDCAKAYLNLLKVRFGDKMKVSIDLNAIDYQDHVVPLVLQLLLENAVKHNSLSLESPLEISISQEVKNYVVVRNNVQAKKVQSESNGTGLANIQSRYELLGAESIHVSSTSDMFEVKVPILKIV